MARAALILAFLSMCLFTVRGSSDEACLSDQCNPGNTSGLGLLQTRGHLNKVQEATADEDTDTDLHKIAEKPLKAEKFFLNSRPQQEIWVHVPAGDGPFPVLIGLHGAGGLDMPTFHLFSVTPGHIVVAPQRNNKDDLLLVHELLDYLCDFSNVVSTGFKVAGYSQGGDMTNRVAIGSDDPRITHLITFMSQLHIRQHHDGHFWTEEGGIRAMDYIHQRKLIQFTGLQDQVCACCDSSRYTCGGYLLTWEESAYRYAQAWGYNGKQLEAAESEEAFSVSYLDGQVQAFNFKNFNHGFPAPTWEHFAPTFTGSSAPSSAPTPAPHFVTLAPSSAAEAAPSSEATPEAAAEPEEEEEAEAETAPASGATTTKDNYRLDERTAGVLGVGVCTCPSGAKYFVGDQLDWCGSLACEGGVASDCTMKSGVFAADEGGGMRVTCAAK